MSSLKVHIYLRNTSSGTGISKNLLWMEQGMKRHGLRPVMLRKGQESPCDLAVTWSARKHDQMASGRHYLVMERGYVGDRFHWTSCGFDGLNGRANFNNDNMPGDRWNKLFARYMKPWRGNYQGSYVLVMGQVPKDASLRGMDIRAWLRDRAIQLSNARIPYKIRPHPKGMPSLREIRPARRAHSGESGQYLLGSLDCALLGARWVVTFNSNSAVDAVLAGVPTVTFDIGAMAYSVTGHDSLNPPPMPDRTQWAYDMAYTQWSPEEISRGDAWDHLKTASLD